MLARRAPQDVVDDRPRMFADKPDGLIDRGMVRDAQAEDLEKKLGNQLRLHLQYFG